MHLRIVAATLAFAALGLALPTGVDDKLTPTRTLEERDDGSPTIVAIMPSSTSCSGRGDECTTAEDAVQYLAASFVEYNVVTSIEQAGLLALIAYESVEMQYKKNTAQTASGNLGRGTVNMQSGDFNVKFAADLGLGSYTADTVLELTSNNKFNFYSAAWYYNTTAACTPPAGDADAWFNSYLTECVGLDSSWKTSQPERWTYWESAKGVWGL